MHMAFFVLYLLLFLIDLKTSMRAIFLSIILLSMQTGVWGEPVTELQPHTEIYDAVLSFLESDLRRQKMDFKIQLGKIDHRLRLPHCEDPLKVFKAPGNHHFGNVSVGVRCKNPKPWTVYTSSRIAVYKHVVVLTKAVPRGAMITNRTITKKRVDLSRTHRQYATELDEVLGKIAKRPLATGSVLNINALSNPKAITYGQQVIILARAGGIHIRMKGTALMDGSTGQRIRVKNANSNRIVEGIVISKGIVRVQF